MACIAVFAGLRIAGRNCAVFLLEFATVQSEKWLFALFLLPLWWIFDISPHSCSTCQVLSVCPAIQWPHPPPSEILYTLLSVASAGKQWAEATIKPFGDYSERHRCGFWILLLSQRVLSQSSCCLRVIHLSAVSYSPAIQILQHCCISKIFRSLPCGTRYKIILIFQNMERYHSRLMYSFLKA